MLMLKNGDDWSCYHCGLVLLSEKTLNHIKELQSYDGDFE